MKLIFKLIKKLFSSASLVSQDESYLAQSADVYDLERRMRHLDNRLYGLNRSRSGAFCLRVR